MSFVLFVLSLVIFSRSAVAYDLEQVEHFTLASTNAKSSDHYQQELLLKLSSGEQLTILLNPVEWLEDVTFKGAVPSKNLQVYRGRLIEHLDSWARITIDGDVLLGVIDDGHRRYEVGNLVRGQSTNSR